MKVFCVNEFLTTLEARISQKGDLCNKNREMRFYVAHSVLLSSPPPQHFYTTLSEPAGRESNAD